ncbi:MAG: DNA mismatch repair protein, partial [Gaiellaceae bacterium]
RRAVASAQAQGLPAKVQEPAILKRVAGLVRPGLAAPDEADPARVEGVASGGGGSDDGVVEDGADDRGLAA